MPLAARSVSGRQKCLVRGTMHVNENLHAPHSKNDKTINIEYTVRIRIQIVVELAE
jgi:hypothetical protein